MTATASARIKHSLRARQTSTSKAPPSCYFTHAARTPMSLYALALSLSYLTVPVPWLLVYASAGRYKRDMSGPR
eukprot:47915-Eustigmatos_ZCMA.PRE.1